MASPNEPVLRKVVPSARPDKFGRGTHGSGRTNSGCHGRTCLSVSSATEPKEPSCPLCGGASARRLVTKRGWDVVRCRGCGMVYVWPQPTQEELERLYSSGEYHATLDDERLRRTSARRLRQIEALAPGRGRLLDVGCSKGHFLEAAKAVGWEVVGVEVNRRAVEEAQARGLDVRCGELAEQAFADASFDVVTLYDVLEHTRDPRATLAECHRVLRPEGLLVVTTPDIGGLVPRFTCLIFARTLGAWGHPTPPGHLLEFSRRTLVQLLEATGFTPIRRRSDHIPFAYAAGKLENSIMDVLAGRHRRRISDFGRRFSDLDRPDPIRTRSIWCRLPRLGVRVLCWLVVGGAGLLARAMAWGDSLWVVARRR